MLRTVDSIACANQWRNHSDAVAVLCLGLMTDALLVPPLPGAPIVILFAILLGVFGAQIPARAYGLAMLLPLGFLAVGTVGLCWSLNMSKGWSLTFSPVAAANAFRVALRAWAATSVTLLFAFTVPIAQFIALLRRLQVPAALLELILLTYRSLFLLDEARSAVLGAQRNRLGYRSVSVALRSSGQAAAALFVRAFLRSMRLERGLTARGYNGSLVVLLPPAKTRARHVGLALFTAVVVGGISFLSAKTWCH